MSPRGSSARPAGTPASASRRATKQSRFMTAHRPDPFSPIGLLRTCGNLIGVFLPSRNAAAAWADQARPAGKKVVITNGVFDLLHPGHVRYRQAARGQGDVLLVAINSDRSVSAIKGPTRPLTPEAERAEVLDALACVDAVVIFDEDTPAEIIAAVQPDVLVKGADWAPDRIVGRDIVEARGGEVVLMPVEQGWSTTSILAKVQALRNNK